MTLNTANARSLGLKLILVGLLAFILWIPALLVNALVYERSSRADAVTSEIYGLAGGRQEIAGPVLLAPATIDTGKRDKNGNAISRTTVVAFTPKSLEIEAAATTQTRRRSIFTAAIFDADATLSGAFGALIPPAVQDGAVSVHWDEAVLAVTFVNAASLKGVRSAPELTINGRSAETAFEPGVEILRRADPEAGWASGISAAVAGVDPSKGFSFRLLLPISGGGGLHFAPAGEETHASISGDWPDPGFNGAYLPQSRAITSTGFDAVWNIPYLARALPRSFIASDGLALLTAGKLFGVDFVQTSSPYTHVNRALKYALMFLGVVFLTFFLFEASSGGKAHAAQYILLGLAQVIFYVLTLALSEHIGFSTAFFLSSSLTVALSGAYAATVFHSKIRGLIAFAAFSGAYGLIYLLMKSEDYALLIGSMTAFAVLALTMFVTRNLDWYGATQE